MTSIHNPIFINKSEDVQFTFNNCLYTVIDKGYDKRIYNTNTIYFNDNILRSYPTNSPFQFFFDIQINNLSCEVNTHVNNQEFVSDGIALFLKNKNFKGLDIFTKYLISTLMMPDDQSSKFYNITQELNENEMNFLNKYSNINNKNFNTKNFSQECCNLFKLDPIDNLNKQLQNIGIPPIENKNLDIFDVYYAH